MSHTTWGIIMLVTLMVNLIMIPGDIREEKYTSATFSIGLAILSAMLMVYHFMSLITN